MNNEQEFLEAIQANPGDLTARLVYADYLDEAGDPRAELVRLVCQVREIDKLGRRYRVLAGRHTQGKVTYRKGDVFAARPDLPMVFSNKFEEVGPDGQPVAVTREQLLDRLTELTGGYWDVRDKLCKRSLYQLRTEFTLNAPWESNWLVRAVEYYLGFVRLDPPPENL